MCAIIYANQSSLAGFVLYRAGGGVWTRPWTLVNMKSVYGAGRADFGGSIDSDRRGRGREEEEEGRRWKVGLDQSAANEEVNGLQASYVSLYAPCVSSWLTASPR